MKLKHLDTAGFLRDFWQKKPLLIKDGWQAWHNPLEPDELAGLACEPEVESRLIARSRASLEVEHGPLPESRFGQLRRVPWTILVQAVDHHVPAVASLLEPFRFVPNWRIDDVMVSYATDGGGVGPHFDQYDVFLVQGLGKRRWQVGQLCDSSTALLPHDELRLLANFEPSDEWVLEPGDILYVPPRVAHNGIAVGDDCMTYSIGFRAPSRGELIAHWSESLVAELDDGDRYSDPGLMAQENPGEISAEAIERLHGMVSERILDRAGFAQWFGQYSSTPKNPEIDWRPDVPLALRDLRHLVGHGASLLRNPASRFSFFRTGRGRVSLFADGQSFDCTEATALFAEQLCAQNRFTVNPDTMACEPTRDLILELCNRGCVAFETD